MFVIPTDTPGVHILRNLATMGESAERGEGEHGYLRFDRARVPLDALLGEPGQGFTVAQARLAGGRLHHAMRTVGRCARAFEMMCERALSRRTQGERLADKQAVQTFIADSWLELQQFRLLVLHTAWLIDTGSEDAARTQIAMCKMAMAKVFHDIVQRSVHVHGALGVTVETPLADMWMSVPALALVDGPTEVHRTTVAKRLLREHQPAPGLFPTEHIPPRRAAARERYADVMDGRS
jgi:acyl-CoA dehydrogenase